MASLLIKRMTQIILKTFEKSWFRLVETFLLKLYKITLKKMIENGFKAVSFGRTFSWCLDIIFIGRAIVTM